MGSISSLMSMIPGLNKLAKQVDPEKQEREFKRIEAIILSMTPAERRNHEILNANRRRRIAKGSGTSVEDINKLIKQFVEMRKMMKQLMKLGPGGLGGLMGGSGLGGLGGLFGRR
jgi:signal recognition particle subunit SRP54